MVRISPPSSTGISSVVYRKARSAHITLRYLRDIVDTWLSRVRCLGCTTAGAGRSGVRWRTEIGVAMYFTKSVEPRYSPDQSRAGSSAKPWKTSAQSDLVKYFSPSAGEPK